MRTPSRPRRPACRRERFRRRAESCAARRERGRACQGRRQSVGGRPRRERGVGADAPLYAHFDVAVPTAVLSSTISSARRSSGRLRTRTSLPARPSSDCGGRGDACGRRSSTPAARTRPPASPSISLRWSDCEASGTRAACRKRRRTGSSSWTSSSASSRDLALAFGLLVEERAVEERDHASFVLGRLRVDAAHVPRGGDLQISFGPSRRGRSSG